MGSFARTLTGAVVLDPWAVRAVKKDVTWWHPKKMLAGPDRDQVSAAGRGAVRCRVAVVENRPVLAGADGHLEVQSVAVNDRSAGRRARSRRVARQLNSRRMHKRGRRAAGCGRNVAPATAGNKQDQGGGQDRRDKTTRSDHCIPPTFCQNPLSAQTPQCRASFHETSNPSSLRLFAYSRRYHLRIMMERYLRKDPE